MLKYFVFCITADIPRAQCCKFLVMARSSFPCALGQRSESDNERCSLNRRSPKMWTYTNTRFSYNIVVRSTCAANQKKMCGWICSYNKTIKRHNFQMLRIRQLKTSGKRRKVSDEDKDEDKEKELQNLRQTFPWGIGC